MVGLSGDMKEHAHYKFGAVGLELGDREDDEGGRKVTRRLAVPAF